MADLPDKLDSWSREVNDFRTWAMELEVQRLDKIINGVKSDGIFKNDNSEVDEESDLRYDEDIRADTMLLRDQRQVPLLRLPGELRNKIYGYLDPDRTKTRTVYTSEYIALSQTSRQLRTEVISYAMNHQNIYVDYTNIGSIGYALKDVNEDDRNGVFVGINGATYAILVHLEPRWKSAVRYFVVKGFHRLFNDEHRKHTVKFLKERLHVGTIKRGVPVEEDAWCYVEEEEEEEWDQALWEGWGMV